MVRDDLRAQLGLLDLRHVAGDAGLSARTRAGRARPLDRHRTRAGRRRWSARPTAAGASRGDAAFLLEPDLKESRGGLRDIGLLRALALAQLIDLPTAVRADERAAAGHPRPSCRPVTGPPRRVLRLQEQDGGGRGARAGRRRRGAARGQRGRPRRRPHHRRRRAPHRRTRHRRVVRPLGTAAAAGPWRAGRRPRNARRWPATSSPRTARWCSPATPTRGPIRCLVLRAARAAAEHDLPLSPFTLERLATETAPAAASRGPPRPATEFVRPARPGPRRRAR